MSFFIFILINLFVAPNKLNAGEKLFGRDKRIIVIDPGHGGYDKGAKGTGKTYEKKLTLKLAENIAKELGGKHIAILTRTDDYWVNIYHRAATANHLNADLFISIHTGGSFLCNTSGINIFYYNKKFESSLSVKASVYDDFDSNAGFPFWNSLQERHKSSGRILARFVRDAILDKTRELKIKIQDAPVLVLEGANMPAILIETGYITNPAEEKKIKNNKILHDISKGICDGINNFFSTQSAPTNNRPN